MGSKRKLASEILSKIVQRHENITDFYDLFGGGGSISFTAIRDYRFNVHYNELNKHIYSLVEYLKNNKELEPKFYEWVTREEFFNQVGKSNTDADWYSGFVGTCWSFGNNSEKGYLYGTEIENIKHIMHDIIVNCKSKSLKEFNKIYKLEIPESIFLINNINERRLSLQKELSKIYQLTKRVDLDKIGARKNIIVDNLGKLENLEKVQNLQNLQNLQTYNASYKDITILGNNPIIYCDIPYKGTGEYKEGGFNHEEFYQWFANLDYPCYLSEYDAPFEKIETFKHRSSLSATNNKKKVFESIYWNGKGEINNYKLF